jgi:hypothetical protein
MARSTDSFFIRQTLNAGNTNTFDQVAIDLGAYVDALGKSVLRLHNVQVTYSDIGGASISLTSGSTAVAQWQITTQSFGALQLSSNRAVVSDGRCHQVNQEAAIGVASVVSDANGINLQEWTNGYLIAVESLYLGGSASPGFNEECYISVVLECTVETLSQSAAMSLALSQQ